MQPEFSTTRRHLGRCLLGVALFPFRRRLMAESAPLQVDRIVPLAADAKVRRLGRYYRADAVILLFSMPLFRRAAVGSGQAFFEETLHGRTRRLALLFSGGSFPERTRGLNKVGSIREIVLERDGIPRDAAYFGVMTSSTEESLDQACRSLAHPAGGTTYSAIDGGAAPGCSYSTVSHFVLPAGRIWSDRRTLLHQARASLAGGMAVRHETRWPGAPDTAPKTFLYALDTAIRDPRPRVECSYLYNEKNYRLSIEKSQDEQQARQFVERGLMAGLQTVLRVHGRIQNQATGRQTSFQLWIEEPGSGPQLPLRIHLQPRSFLRLTFEYDPSAPQPSLENEKI